MFMKAQKIWIAYDILVNSNFLVNSLATGYFTDLLTQHTTLSNAIYSTYDNNSNNWRKKQHHNSNSLPL